MTMLDTITDVVLLIQWYRDKHTWWFIIGLCIILFSDIIEGLLFCDHNGKLSGAIHLSGVGAVYELVRWWESGDEEDFEWGKIFEVCFEAAPFLILQSYVMVIEEEYSIFSIISLAFTCSSLGYVAASTNIRSGRLNEMHTSAFVFLIFLCAIDVILRTSSIALLLKVFTSLSMRIYIASCFVTVYFCLGFFIYLDVHDCFLLVVSVSYPVMNIQYFELETIFRGMLTVTIFVFAYTKDVVNGEGLGVGITFTMVYIIISLWRLCVRDDRKMIREKAHYLLGFSCCIFIARHVCSYLNRAEHSISTNDDESTVEVEMDSMPSFT